MRGTSGNGFWERNDQILAGEMHPVTRVLWVAMMTAIGMATMCALWIASR